MFRRVLVTVTGGILTLAGIAALVLPGPGIVLCVAGLALLATEYPWARRALRTAQAQAQSSQRRTAASLPATTVSVVGGVVLIVVGVLEIVVDLPVLNTVTALLVLAGGLFVIGSALQARHAYLRASRFGSDRVR